ncbi:MAG: Rrf2 family transcriptional regulator [Oscillospiraceae bacterium]|nr:Rrf2 family transcriptional regulator [Oscillospiraceae bacterium]
MQLNMASDYAIRALLYLALVNRMAPVSEISEKMKIPKQYMVTLSLKLRNAKLIDVRRGQTGGYFLARRPENITLLEIICVTEQTMNLNRCLEEDRFCNRCATNDCPVREVYEKLQGTMEGLLGSTTLEDLKQKVIGKNRDIYFIPRNQGGIPFEL